MHTEKLGEARAVAARVGAVAVGAVAVAAVGVWMTACSGGSGSGTSAAETPPSDSEHAASEEAPPVGGAEGGQVDASRLTGATWVVEAIGDEPIAEGTRATLAFDAEEGRLAGEASCNRYSAAYTLDGDTLELGPAMSTRMACPPPRMEQERRFLEVLSAVARVGLLEAGDVLVLYARDGRTIRARREGEPERR